MLDKFLEYLSAEKRYSPHTVTNYAKDIRDFSAFVLDTEGEKDIVHCEKKVIRNFIASLSEGGLAKRSINRKLSSLRSFYLFLLKIGEVSVSPMEGVTSLKFYVEKQIPISKEEMAALEENMATEAGLLERLIIEVLYQTGIRKSELCGILLENVDFAKSEIRVVGKGNKMRAVPVSPQLLAQIKTYIAERRPHPDTEKNLFVNRLGKKITEKFVYLTVKSYLGLVTSKEKRSPHILRHSFATHVLDNGAEISKVKEILGHASLASTQVYTGANIAQLKKVYAGAHPRSKKEQEEE